MLTFCVECVHVHMPAYIWVYMCEGVHACVCMHVEATCSNCLQKLFFI